MSTFETILTTITVSLLSIYGFGQTQEFTDRTEFENALSGSDVTCEEFSSCEEVNFDETFTGFMIEGENTGCYEGSNPDLDNTWLVRFANTVTITFDEPTNVFGLDWPD